MDGLSSDSNTAVSTQTEIPSVEKIDTDFPSERREPKIAFRPRGDINDGTSFWLQIKFEEDGYYRPDMFDMSELINLQSLFYGEEFGRTIAFTVMPEERYEQKTLKRYPFDTPSPRASSPAADDDASSSSSGSPPVPTEGPQHQTLYLFPNIEIHNKHGNKISNERKIKKCIVDSREDGTAKETKNCLYYISLKKRESGHHNKPDGPFELLTKEIDRLKKELKITDTRMTSETTHLTDCLNVVRGLHVGKASTIDNVIEPLYVVCEGIQWSVHNIHRVSKRVLAEIEMINIELRRRLDFKFNILELLKKPKSEDDGAVSYIVAAFARCLDARLTFSWYKHNTTVSKHLTASRKTELDSEMYILISEINQNSSLLS